MYILYITSNIKIIVEVELLSLFFFVKHTFSEHLLHKRERKQDQQKCNTTLLWHIALSSDHIGMSGSADLISLIQCLFVSYSGQAEPHSFPKAPLCHELSLNATLLSIDLLAMHFLSCFDVIVVSVYGRFQIKLWRVLAFKPVISGDYSAAVELTFLFFFWPQTGLCDSLQQRRYQMPIAKCNYHEPPPLWRRPVQIGSGEKTVPGICVR